jgi:hypothetical protein
VTAKRSPVLASETNSAAAPAGTTSDLKAEIGELRAALDALRARLDATRTELAQYAKTSNIAAAPDLSGYARKTEIPAVRSGNIDNEQGSAQWVRVGDIVHINAVLNSPKFILDLAPEIKPKYPQQQLVSTTTPFGVAFVYPNAKNGYILLDGRGWLTQSGDFMTWEKENDSVPRVVSGSYIAQ